jgi:acetyl-CoA carboxylase biotin carboxyl carrier protein
MKRKKPSKPSTGRASDGPEIEQIERLLRTMNEHNLEEFEYSRGDFRIRLKKPSMGTALTQRPMHLPEIIVPSAPPSGAPESNASGPGVAETPFEVRGAQDLHLVKSPIVGTYYASPSPGAGPFVKIGGFVEAGQTLCIVEAMKLMNEIESDVSGEVLRIFAENGQPVEYGQPLFGIRPSRKK